MKEMNKSAYEAPEVMIVEVAVEKGFAVTATGGATFPDNFGREGW